MSIHQLLDDLTPHLGQDQPLESSNTALKEAVQRLGPDIVGAQHVTCSDEAEHETADSFQRHFCEALLPRLSHDRQAAFRGANLGGRYEWKSARLAEDHFATEPSAKGYKLMVIRTSSHVGVSGTESEPTFGSFLRYDRISMGCGMLAAVLGGDQTPGGHELRATLQSEGVDRGAQIEARAENERWLVAALVQARLQARNAAIDLMDYRPATPTVYLVVASVTLNRPFRDSEIVCGYYLIDQRNLSGPVPDLAIPTAPLMGDDAARLPGNAAVSIFQGLGDQPSEYRISINDGAIRVSDPHIDRRSRARDHRALIRTAYRKSGRLADLARATPQIQQIVDQSTKGLTDAANSDSQRIFAAQLSALAEHAPRSAALFLFAEGASGIFHVWKMHEIARRADSETIARNVLTDLRERIPHLPGAEIDRVSRTLLQELTR